MYIYLILIGYEVFFIILAISGISITIGQTYSINNLQCIINQKSSDIYA